MTVPNATELKHLQKILNQGLTLKLFSNNITLAETDTAGSFTEVTGGGYVAKSLTYANWVMVEGSPTRATYPIQEFNFTGITGGSGIVYGYYIIDDGGIIFGREKFTQAFTPEAGAVLRITPRYSAE